MLKQVEPAAPHTSDSADALLRALDAELITRRSQRESSQGRRVAVIAGGLLLIVGGTAVALAALFSTIHELPHGERMASAPAGQSTHP